MGTPRPSVSRCRLQPHLPRSTGLRPVASVAPAPLVAQRGLDDALVGGPPLPVDPDLAVVHDEEARPGRVEAAVGDPFPEAVVDDRLGPELARRRRPLAAVARQPDQAVEDGPVVASRPPRLLARLVDDQQGPQLGPQGVVHAPDRRGVLRRLGRGRRGVVRVHPAMLLRRPTFRMGCNALRPLRPLRQRLCLAAATPPRRSDGGAARGSSAPPQPSSLLAARREVPPFSRGLPHARRATGPIVPRIGGRNALPGAAADP